MANAFPARKANLPPQRIHARVGQVPNARDERVATLAGSVPLRPLRLLVVGNGPTGVDAQGGHHVDRTVGDFLVELADAGHDVSFLQAIEPLEAELNNFGPALPTDRLHTIVLNKHGLKPAVQTTLEALRALVRADVVYLFFAGKLPRLVEPLCRLLGKAFGVYVRSQDFEHGGKDAELFRRANFILAASRGIADQVEALGANVTMIRPMCTISGADAVVRDHTAPRAGPLRLLFVGQLTEDKGVLDVVEAFEMVRARGLEAELKVVGTGDLYTQLAKRYPPGKADGVELVGTVGDPNSLMRLYEQADLFVLPTHREGFPRVLYEAMIKSAVVITTEVGGIPALMKNEQNCLTVPIKTPDAVAAAIERLATDPPLRQRLADAALRSAIDVLDNHRTHSEVLLTELEKLR